jgi:hypothetical protein
MTAVRRWTEPGLKLRCGLLFVRAYRRVLGKPERRYVVLGAGVPPLVPRPFSRGYRVAVLLFSTASER